MEVQEFYIETSFGKLHGLRSVTESRAIPVVFIHGMLGQASDWENDFESFFPRPCFALSLRGRGESDFPRDSLSVQDHAKDIKALVDFFKLDKILLVGFSQGALYAMAYAIECPEKIAGLVVQDKALKQKKFGEAWVTKARQHPVCGGRTELLKGLAANSRDMDLLKVAGPVKEKPILIIKGEHSAMMADEDLMEMERFFVNSSIEIFPDSGHDIASPDYSYYTQRMQSFFESVDKGPSE